MTIEAQPISLHEHPNISLKGMWARGAERFRKLARLPFNLLRPSIATQETSVVEPKVAKTRKMLELEQRFGTNIEGLLSGMYNGESKTQAQVATELGIGRSTVSSWMKRFGIETRQAINRRMKQEEQRKLGLALVSLEQAELQAGKIHQRLYKEPTWKVLLGQLFIPNVFGRKSYPERLIEARQNYQVEDVLGTAIRRDMAASGNTHNSAWFNEQAQFLRTNLRYGENLSKTTELLGISDYFSYLRKRDERRINNLKNNHWKALSAIFATSSVVAMLTVPYFSKKTDYARESIVLVRAASSQSSAAAPKIDTEKKNQVMEKRAELVGEQLPRWDKVITDAISKTSIQLDVSEDELDPGLIKAVNIKVRSTLELTANITAADQNPDFFRWAQQEKLLENQVRLSVYRLMNYLLVDDVSDNDQQLADGEVIKTFSTPYRHNLLSTYNFLRREGFEDSDLLFVLKKVRQWQRSENFTGDRYIDIMAEFNQQADGNETAEGKRAVLTALLSKHLNLEEQDVVFVSRLREMTLKKPTSEVG